jgi:hypothetical protein
MAPDAAGAVAPCSLSAADRLLVASKSRANRLAFAIMLAFSRSMGRLPRPGEALGPATVAHIARQVGCDVSDSGEAHARTLKRHRAEIRALLGFREATVADADALAAWLRDHAVAGTRDAARLGAAVEERCRVFSIEPPTPERVERIIRAAVHAYEGRLYATVLDRLTPDMRTLLDELLQPAGSGDVTAFAADVEQEGRATAPLNLPAQRSRPRQRQQPARRDPTDRASSRPVPSVDPAGAGLPTARGRRSSLRIAAAF